MQRGEGGLGVRVTMFMIPQDASRGHTNKWQFSKQQYVALLQDGLMVVPKCDELTSAAHQHIAN